MHSGAICLLFVDHAHGKPGCSSFNEDDDGRATTTHQMTITTVEGFLVLGFDVACPRRHRHMASYGMHYQTFRVTSVFDCRLFL